ncbi:hypothetical protein GPJ56_000295 [Histomonas meleagridis]|uniref:uncharacterized protein n=1 Tax=Histomonas meleagridis TaxID=135588 RepID=UPI0035594DED|nr:hypothetical protein GPJ56_000295 [Histomonas meleagridis]KAH0806813.1 hypothetical protein GO595_000456 [Histomonas meleagridis]
MESYYPNEKLLHPSIEVWGTASKPTLPTITRRNAAEDTMIHYSETPTSEGESVKVENPICGETMTVTLTLDNSRGAINASNPVPFVLWDGSKTFNIATMTSNPYRMLAPCAFADNSSYTLIAHLHNPTSGIIDYLQTKVTFQNKFEPNQLIKPKPYDVINLNDGLQVQWTRNDTQLKYGLYNEKFVMDVIDNDNMETIASQEMLTGPDIGAATITLDRECVRCVLTVTPVLESRTDPCSSFITPFSALTTSKAPEKFALNLKTDRCKIQDGIIVGSNEAGDHCCDCDCGHYCCNTDCWNNLLHEEKESFI